MPVLIKVKQVTNEKSLGYGRFYGRVVAAKAMTYRELCKHMAEHNSVYGEDVCLGVANKLQNRLLEQLPVKGKGLLEKNEPFLCVSCGFFCLSLRSE